MIKFATEIGMIPMHAWCVFVALTVVAVRNSTISWARLAIAPPEVVFKT